MRRHKSSERGAVFVEALIVISVFVVFLLGILYFRDLYLVKIQTQRLSRAGAMAHAMSGCQVDAQTLLQKDLPESRSPKQGASNNPIPPKNTTPGQDDPEATAMLGEVGGGRGGNFLDPIDSVSLSGSAAATTKSGPLAPEFGFKGNVSSTSYVTCGEILTTDQYTGIPGKVVELIYSKRKSK